MNNRWQNGRENNDPFPAGRGFVNNQPDMQSRQAFIDRNKGGHVSLDRVIDALDARNLPPQVRNTPYYAHFNGGEKPKLIIPANPNRMGFIIAFVTPNIGNDTDFITMSYGPSPIAALGIPILTGTSYQEGNGTVSIDDIYIGIENVTSQAACTIVAYEAVLAIESRLHNQTGGA